MRLRREMIQYLAQTVTRELSGTGCVHIAADHEKVENLIRDIIADDLQVEDRLNDEVKGLLRAFSSEFNRGEADYHKMFTLVKRKLVQERGLIL
jgi:hypothetical protein